MSFVNICRDNTDPFYRYKMPTIVWKVEGRGNGIKTAVVNTSEVARALNRPAPYIIKYFGFELGAQTSINETNDRYLVNGSHDGSKLQDTLDGFINKFVLCGACKNPETEITITKGDNLIKECKACGHKTDVDPRHKLSSYISKNPPESSKSKKKKAATASANVGGFAMADIAAKKKESNDEDEEANADDDAYKNVDTSAFPEAKSISVEDHDWSVDVSEEAVRKRAMELESMSMEDSASTTSFEQFGEWLLSSGKDKAKLPSDVEIYKKASELEIIEDAETVQVLAQTLFDSEIATQITEHTGLLTKLITSAKHEKAFLGGIERFLGLEHPELLPQISKILLQIYENDIVSENSIKDWGSKVSKKYVSKEVSKKVKKAAKPFIKWLEEAESEDESD